MTKVTRQASGVVPGSSDLSRRTTPDVAKGTSTSEVLTRRKAVKVRAAKAEKRSRAKKKVSAKSPRTSRR